MISLLHTPDGVRDLYGEELNQKIAISSLILNTISRYGYERIDTPAFEYFDVFSKDIGTIPSKDLYKFFDKEGNTLVLRPDFTPSVARCAAKYFTDSSLPLRFSYNGNTYINTNELQGKLKETTQIGFELINDSSIYADAEALSIVIESLLKVGITEFQVSIGESNYFKGLCEEANLDEDTEMTLRDFITSKNYYAAREYLKKQNIDAAFLDRLEAISKVFLPEEELINLAKNVTNDRSKNAIERLIAIKNLLSKKGYDRYISFDLTMLSKYHYYTGIIFTAYTYGIGNAIAKGGRYDNLIEKFGKEAPSVGCVFMIDEIQTAIRRQGIEIKDSRSEKTVIIYTEDLYEKAVEEADKRRQNGESAELVLANPENKILFKEKETELGNLVIVLE